MTPIPDFIPQANPAAAYQARAQLIQAAVQRVLESGRYILGPEVQSFEEEFAAYLGVPHCVGVANGTDALEIALRAGDIGPGKAVFVPSHTAVATIAAIERAGDRPCFVDVDPASLTMDTGHLTRAIAGCKPDADAASPWTGAIIPVHLYGYPANMPAIMEIARAARLLVVEDCAQAHGARIEGRCVGAWGDLAAFSFYPTKNLGALGDAGAVVTRTAPLASRIRQLREYGWRERYISRSPGINSRLDELQAAVLRVQLVSLDSDNSQRARIAGRYFRHLDGQGLQMPALPSNGHTHAWHQFVVRTPRRDALVKALAAAGIGTGIHYPQPVHLQPAYRNRIPLPPGGLPVTEKICGSILSLPMFPQLADAAVDRVCRAILDTMESVD